MCGIVARFGGKPENIVDDVWRVFTKQEGRGSDGFGFIALKDGKIIRKSRRTHEGGIKDDLDKAVYSAPDCVLFHHRFPTSTINVAESAHPLPIDLKGWRNKYYILHNGVVSGEDMSEIHKAGYQFKSRVDEITYYRVGKKLYEHIEDSNVNDSETLGFYIAQLLEGQRTDIPMTGAIACLMLQENKETKQCTLYAMRNHMNPLKVQRHKKELLVSSENDGGAELPAHKIHVLDWKTLRFHEYSDTYIGKGIMGYQNSPYSWHFDDKLKTSEPLTLPSAKSEKELIANAVAIKTKEADKAYCDWEEALSAWGGEDDPEAQAYILECERKYDEAEEALSELTGETRITEADIKLQKDFERMPF